MRDRVGPYRISRKLGEGGMGVVYAAHDERLDRAVALKMLRAAPDDPHARERLRREARAAASVNHPHVCQVYDIGEDEGELTPLRRLPWLEPLRARPAFAPLLARCERAHAEDADAFVAEGGPQILGLRSTTADSGDR